MDLEEPFRLTETEAIAQWHKDLRDSSVRKSEKRMWNPTSRKFESFTRIHVQVDELEHRKSFKEILVWICVSIIAIIVIELGGIGLKSFVMIL